MADIRFAEDTEPATPVAGKVVVYADSTDSHIKQKDDTGTVTDLTEGSGINVKEADASPDVSNVTTIVVSNGTLTDDGGGQVTLSTGGGGSSVRSWTLTGGVSGVGGNSTTVMSTGHNAADGPFIMIRAGQIIGISFSINNTRTGGTCQLQVRKNGVAQTGLGQIINIDGSNPVYNYIEFGSPIAYAAGDRITAQTVTTGFGPTGSDASIAIFCEDT